MVIRTKLNSDTASSPKRRPVHVAIKLILLLTIVVLSEILFFNNKISRNVALSKLDTEVHPTLPTTKIQELTQELEQEITPTAMNLRYYVYDDELLTLPQIREKALNDSKPQIWKRNWGQRFADYARGEIRWLEALERHSLRTINASEAAFFVVPIPVGATFFWSIDNTNKNNARVTAFRHLLNHSLFRRYPERHVAAFAMTEKVFGSWWGLSEQELQQFKPTTIVRDSNKAELFQWLDVNNKTYGMLKKTAAEWDQIHQIPDKMYFRNIVSLGWSFEGSNPDNAYEPVTMECWTNKAFWFFYHSRRAPCISESNSTIFRHALLPSSFILKREQQQNKANYLVSDLVPNDEKNTTVILSIPERFKHQPVSIGFDIPHKQWIKEFTDAKFCLIIRGDTAGSRALFRAIRAGCMPLIVSDILPVYQQLYTKSIKYDDFAISLSEDNFLQDPIKSVEDAVSSLSPADLRSKLEGLRLMQRVVACDQPDSLFTPTFAREIVLTMSNQTNV